MPFNVLLDIFILEYSSVSRMGLVGFSVLPEAEIEKRVRKDIILNN